MKSLRTTGACRASPLIAVAVMVLIAINTPGLAGEVVIDNTVHNGLYEYNPGPNIVFLNSTTGYVFFIDGPTNVGGSVVYRKTVDGGTNWGTMVSLGEDQNAGTLSVWYDRWTPGDTGTLIHVVHVGELADDVYYNRIDTETDTPVPWEAVRLGTAWTAGTYAGPSICKSTEGRLFVYSGLNTGVATGMVSWSADGISWEIADPTDLASGDYGQMLPLKNGDVLLVLQDISADRLESIVWSSATTNWQAWTTNVATWVEYAGMGTTWGASVYTNTGDIYLVGHTAPNPLTLTGDLIAYRFNEASRTWTTLGTVYDDNLGTVSGGPVMVDQNNGDLYAVYTRGGQEYFVSVYFKKSVDGGFTWSEESDRLNSTGDDYRNVRGCFGGSELLFAAWYDADDHYLYGSVIADIGANRPLSSDIAVSNTAGAVDAGSTNAFPGGRVTGGSTGRVVSVCWATTDQGSNPYAWTQTQGLSF